MHTNSHVIHTKKRRYNVIINWYSLPHDGAAVPFLLIILIELVEERTRYAKFPYCFYKLFVSAADISHYLLQVFWKRFRWTSEADISLFSSIYPFVLTSAYLVSLVLSDSSEHFDKDNVYHFEYPCLIQ